MRSKQQEWEYLPMSRALLPIIWHFIKLAFQNRDILFFSNVNPSIEFSGMLGESKIDILNQIPAAFKPQTLFLSEDLTDYECLDRFEQSMLSFPVVIKPNVGERGFLVRLIHNEEQLKHYIKLYGVDLIVQEYIDLPEELALFYYRLPGEKEIHISSVCKKAFLSVQGDGQSTVLELMQKNNRAKRQIQRFKIEKAALLSEIPQKGEVLVLEKIGNHSKGTAFLNGEEIICQETKEVFQKIALKMPQIHYGRFDLKYRSPDHLKNGKDIRIMEFNGVSAEPAHIYDPAIPIAEKYRIYKSHYSMISTIHQIQKKRGISTGSLYDFLKFALAYKRRTDLNRIPYRKVHKHEQLVVV